MSRDTLPLTVPDVSALARVLGRELAQIEGKPGHVQLLNMLARAGGYRNFQHFRSASKAGERLAEPRPAPEPVDHALVERVAGHFDDEGQFLRWPSRYRHQSLALWVLWSRLKAGTVYSEFDVSKIIRNNHRFGDHALIRRAMIDAGLLTRTLDGREYRRVERRPPGEALALIHRISTHPSA
ncbi:DUF2087 domain-containing protein [Pleomorphomonas sp. JP5]|uniref:DUF2087 domain-containing protein n=1 Tax=Pleomorphomonas sp. JP5 TaxID=2942998 RepID=UPI002044BFB5|nr:DUF2087 domain-containing protein [Pleomorphomonas sp. JP5]MCM5560147.1 DUF2087 domain-containing protein [Pleomorphomonas sp. JP5]